jgi:predicted Fe-S protein YdhL (DUF1289 family)
MTDDIDKGLSDFERLSAILGKRSLSGSPCTGGVCTTTLGDQRCKTCGRYEDEILEWNELSEVVRKGINMKNISQGYKIRQTFTNKPKEEEE